MTGPEHYRRAEEMLEEATSVLLKEDVSWDDRMADRDTYVSLAQVHATLALAAATAVMRDMDGAEYTSALTGWNKAAGTQT